MEKTNNTEVNIIPSVIPVTKGQNAVKTAFVLSGGGARGAYQCGVWRAIKELGIKIDIVIGVSVGALNGAMVMQGDQTLAANLWRELETDQVFDVDGNAQLHDYAREFFRKGGATPTGLKALVDKYLDESAIRASEKDFGLITVEVPLMKAHYLWKEDIPEGQLGDYIMASSAAFPAVHTYKIDGKDFIDGGYENNMPINMAFDRGATKVIAVYLKAVGKFDPNAELARKDDIMLIEPSDDLGDFLVFDKINTRRIMRLGYLDAMKKFEVYDGDIYSFVKGDFDKRTLKQAEAAAKIFALDKLILYRRKSFLASLLESVLTSISELNERINKIDFSPDSTWELLKQFNAKNATILIAHNIMQKGDSSIFLNRYTPSFLSEQVQAAKFLVKYGLI